MPHVAVVKKRTGARIKRYKQERNNAVACPLCNAGTGTVEILKEDADLLMISPGSKIVCLGKFIYKSNPDQIQFSECYGIPVEFSLKMLQNGFKREDIFQLVSKRKEITQQNVIDIDPFFANMAKYVKKEPIILVDNTPIEEKSFDIKEFLSDGAPSPKKDFDDVVNEVEDEMEVEDHGTHPYIIPQSDDGNKALIDKTIDILNDLLDEDDEDDDD